MTEAMVPTPHLVVDSFDRLPTLSPSAKSPDRIAFGSCNNQYTQNNLWPIIESRKPAAFVWGGDAIYADEDLPLDWSEFPPKKSVQCGTPDRLRALYKLQRFVPGYRSLIQSNITIFGTIDDHDYGCNNADRTFPHKLESAKAFVDFIDEPRKSAMNRRARAGHGVYGVKLFDFDRPHGHQLVPEDEAGIDPDVGHSTVNLHSNKTVAVFVLDCRSNKTPWKSGTDSFLPDYNGDFLGERQWAWFETAIRRSRASVNVIVNGLQVHGDRFPDGNVAESWSKYPRAQQRLFDAILAVESPILISGDVHMAQFSRKDCRREDFHQVKSLVEMTTSGMTHSWGTLSGPPSNEIDFKPSFQERYESFFAGMLMQALHLLCPWTELMLSAPSNNGLYESGGAENAKTGKQFSLQKNFGELEFDWEERTVTMRAIGEDSSPLLSGKWSMDQLSGRATMPGSLLTKKDFDLQRKSDSVLGSKWTCVNHRGRVSVMEQMLGHVATGFVLTLAPFPVLVPVYFLLIATGRLLRRKRTLVKDDSIKPKLVSVTPLLQ